MTDALRSALRPITAEDLMRSAARPAAPANDDAEPAPGAPYVEPDGDEVDQSLHALFEEWATWTRNRRYRALMLPASPPVAPSAEVRALVAAIATPPAQLMALHLAIVSQPPEALDRRVFEMHYITRVMNVKAAAAAMKISRNHWYRLISAFRRRVYTISQDILEETEALKRGSDVS